MEVETLNRDIDLGLLFSFTILFVCVIPLASLFPTFMLMLPCGLILSIFGVYPSFDAILLGMYVFSFIAISIFAILYIRIHPDTELQSREGN